MRPFFVFILVWCNFSIVFSQDVLVLRKNETELKCRIISLNDSLVTYRLWKSQDTTTYTIKKFELQSFLMDNKSQKSKTISVNRKDENADFGLLGEYRTGSTVTGYVLLNNGDSINGLISIKNVAANQLQVAFSDTTGKARVYTTKEAKGYGYQDIIYERIQLKYKKRVANDQGSTETAFFLHRAVNGPSKLYRFYVLHFSNSTMNAYSQNPPFYLGKIKRQFVITNPEGKSIFTKGRTLKGTLNRIYFDYPVYTLKYPVKNPKAGDLPAVVESFNYWFENKVE